MDLFLLIVLTIAILLGPLVSFLRNKNYGLYQGIIDDSFLAYFEGGGEYTVLELLQRIDRITEGTIKLPKRDTEIWIKECVALKKLEMFEVKRLTKRGSYKTIAYALPKTAP